MKHIYCISFLVLLIITSASCKKDPDLLEVRCMLQNGELYRPKIVRSESSFKISSNIPNELYSVYIYNDEELLTEGQDYDKSDSSLYRTTYFIYTGGRISEYFSVGANNTPSSSTYIEHKDGYLYKIKGSGYTWTYYRDHCNFIYHESTSEDSDYVLKQEYEINDGNITTEKLYSIHKETGETHTTTWYNYRYYKKPNQVISMEVLKPMDFNRNLLRSEEKCVRWSDGHTACAGADFEYDFDEQGRITKMTQRERGKLISEDWYYYE